MGKNWNRFDDDEEIKFVPKKKEKKFDSLTEEILETLNPDKLYGEEKRKNLMKEKQKRRQNFWE